MKTVVVANPQAGNGKVGRQWANYARSIANVFGPVEFCQTAAPGEATVLVRRAIHAGASRIVVVGGDGSINEVVNGFFENDQPIGAEVALAIWPAGTGSDFARSIGLSGVCLASGFASAVERRIDVGKASFINHEGHRESRYFLNMASCGASGFIATQVNATSKRLGGRVSFFIGTLRGLLAYQNQRVCLRIDDRFEEEMVINTVAVANGRYFGGGMMVAPNSLLDDGALDVVVVGDVGVMTFLRDAPRLYRGRHLDQPHVRSFRSTVVEIQPLDDAPVLLEVDGEQVGRLPVRYDILQKALRLFAPDVI